MLFAHIADWTPSDWGVLIGFATTGLISIIGAIRANRSVRLTEEGNSATKRIQSDVAAVIRKQGSEVMDPTLRKQVSEIHEATNGKMSEQFRTLHNDVGELKAIKIEALEQIKGLRKDVGDIREEFKAEIKSVRTELAGKVNVMVEQKKA